MTDEDFLSDQAMDDDGVELSPVADETTPRPSSPGADGSGSQPRGPGRLPPGTPTHFGRYEVRRVLGHGAFGRVYLAHDALMERHVAIKAPKDPVPPDKHRDFLREARVLADVHHPNVCPVHDVGIQDESPYIVMRYVGGGTLNDLIARDPPTPARALRLAEQIAHGLEAAHARGIFHRDLKPANVLYDDKCDELLLTDFGVARWADATSTLGGTPGTPLYMAPEQWAPGGPFGPVSARTDVYCLGVVLFQLLTGTRLFDATVYELMNHHCQTPPRRPSAVRPGLDPRLDDLCLKALAKKQGDRYHSAKKFAEAIAACLGAPATPAPKDRWPITVPGVWLMRPDDATESEWLNPVRTPAEVTVRPGERYRLSAATNVQDTDLAGLALLKDLAAFKALSLAGCDQITDAGLRHLKNLTSLQGLSLSGCSRITDAGLFHLRGLAELDWLALDTCTKITDVGLLCLEGLPLEWLNLGGCRRVTDAGVAALKRALPRCAIDR